VLSHAFSRQLPGFSIGTTIMMRDVGVRYQRGQKLTLAAKNQLRQDRDVKFRTPIIEALNRRNLKFSERDFLVLAQPSIDEPELYWKSIEDFLIFTASVASARANITGESLIKLFGPAKPFVIQIADFSNPSLPFGVIMEKVATRYLTKACRTTTAAVTKEMHQDVNQMNSLDIRSGLQARRVQDTIAQVIRDFER
jgi:hypothetical protein